MTTTLPEFGNRKIRVRRCDLEAFKTAHPTAVVYDESADGSQLKAYGEGLPHVPEAGHIPQWVAPEVWPADCVMCQKPMTDPGDVLWHDLQLVFGACPRCLGVLVAKVVRLEREVEALKGR